MFRQNSNIILDSAPDSGFLGGKLYGATKTSSDPYILSFWEAMRAPDADKFKEGMIQEFQDHCNKNHWEFVPRSSLPPGTKVLPSVWSMRCKRCITTREVYKWKSCLTVHGGRSIKGIHYWETYSPMVRWATIRLAIILALIYGWHSCQMDFVLAYTQLIPKHNSTWRYHKDLPTMVLQMDMFSSSRKIYMEPRMLAEFGMSICANCLSRNMVLPNPVLTNVCFTTMELCYLSLWMILSVSARTQLIRNFLKQNWSKALKLPLKEVLQISWESSSPEDQMAALNWHNPTWLIPFSKTLASLMTKRRKLATRGPQPKLDAFSEVTRVFNLITKHGTTILLWASSISWRNQQGQILPMPLIIVLAFQVIPESATLKLCLELVPIYLQPDLKDLFFNPKTIPLIVGSMQILLVIGLPNVILLMLTMWDQELVMSFNMQAAQSSGDPSYKEELLFPQLKQNTLQFPPSWESVFLWQIFCKNFTSMDLAN